MFTKSDSIVCAVESVDKIGNNYYLHVKDDTGVTAQFEINSTEYASLLYMKNEKITVDVYKNEVGNTKYLWGDMQLYDYLVIGSSEESNSTEPTVTEETT